MGNTYTNKLKKRLPAVGDFDWDDEWHDNEKIDDFVAGGLCSQNRLIAGGVFSVGSGLYPDFTALVAVVAGVRYELAAGNKLCTANSINYLYLNSSGVMTAATTPPSGEYLPLAVVDCDATTVIRIGDCRPLAPVVIARENVFINGDMGIDQENEGAAVSVSTTDKYFLDMQLCSAANNSAVVDAQQVAGFGGFIKAAKLTVTTADSLASGEHGHGLTRYIEFKDCQLIAGRWFPFKFKFQAKITGTYSVAVQSGDGGNSYVTTISYTVAEAVQDVSLLVPVPSSKVIEGTNNRGLILHVGKAAVGTKATATLNAWQAGDYVSASTANNWEGTIGNYIAITGLYGGPDLIPAEFPFRPAGAEMVLCQRYVCKSYDQGVVPGTAGNYAGNITEYATRNAANNTFGVRFPVGMRAIPNATLYSPATGASGKILNNGDKTVTAAAGMNGIHGVIITAGDAAYASQFHFLAKAQM